MAQHRLTLSVRGLMGVVAVAALTAWCLTRRTTFLRLAAEHESRQMISWSGGWRGEEDILFCHSGRDWKDRKVSEDESDWHLATARRLRAAARVPWMPAPAVLPFEPFRREALIRRRMQDLHETRAEAESRWGPPVRPPVAAPTPIPEDMPQDAPPAAEATTERPDSPPPRQPL